MATSSRNKQYRWYGSHMRTVQELDIRDFTEEMELYSGIISETKEQFKVVFQSQRDVPFVMVGTIWRDRGTMAVTKETSPKEINHLTSGYRDGWKG